MSNKFITHNDEKGDNKSKFKKVSKEEKGGERGT